MQQQYTQPQTQQIPQQQHYQKPQTQQFQNNAPLDYSSLYNLGLTIMEQGQNLVVIGDDIFSKKDSIKACGFRWSGENKMWYKPLEQQAA
jgi:DNA repair and recombination protein RAD52